MFLVMLSYVVFCSYKSRQITPEDDPNNSKKYFLFAILGIFFGLLFGVFFSPVLTQLLFTDAFIKGYSNPDIGIFSFYILITLASMVSWSLISVVIYGYTHRKG